MQHVSPGETQGLEGGSRFIPEDIREDRSTEKPAFTETLAESLSVEEGEPLRLQATLKPANDPLMKIEWFFNGQSLRLGIFLYSALNYVFLSEHHSEN